MRDWNEKVHGNTLDFDIEDKLAVFDGKRLEEIKSNRSDGVRSKELEESSTKSYTSKVQESKNSRERSGSTRN